MDCSAIRSAQKETPDRYVGREVASGYARQGRDRGYARHVLVAGSNPIFGSGVISGSVAGLMMLAATS